MKLISLLFFLLSVQFGIGQVSLFQDYEQHVYLQSGPFYYTRGTSLVVNPTSTLFSDPFRILPKTVVWGDYTEPNQLFRGFVLFSLDLAGNLQDEWRIPLNGASLQLSRGAIARKLIKTQDGGYIMIGDSYREPATGFVTNVFRVDKSLNQLWSQTIIANGSITSSDIIEHQSGDFYIVGTVDQNANRDVFVAHLDDVGNLLNTHIVDFGEDGSQEFGTALVEHPHPHGNGDILITGATTYGLEGTDKLFAMRMTTSGQVIWTSIMNDPDGYSSFGHDIVASPISTPSDGDFYIGGYKDYTGEAFPNLSRKNFFLLKIDGFGNFLWEGVYGGAEEEVCFDLHLKHEPGGDISDLRLSMVGFSESYSIKENSFFVQVDGNGTPISSVSLTSDDESQANEITYDEDHYVMIGEKEKRFLGNGDPTTYATINAFAAVQKVRVCSQSPQIDHHITLSPLYRPELASVSVSLIEQSSNTLTSYNLKMRMECGTIDPPIIDPNPPGNPFPLRAKGKGANQLQHFMISPNPVGQYQQVLISYQASEDINPTLELWSLTGQLVLKEQVFPTDSNFDGYQQAKVNLQVLNSGVYLAVLNTSEGTFTHKIVIQ